MKTPAERANEAIGYGPNNPEPPAFKESKRPEDKDALHTVGEYIEGRNSGPAVK